MCTSVLYVIFFFKLHTEKSGRVRCRDLGSQGIGLCDDSSISHNTDSDKQ
jgi:hypothetical protein